MVLRGSFNCLLLDVVFPSLIFSGFRLFILFTVFTLYLGNTSLLPFLVPTHQNKEVLPKKVTFLIFVNLSQGR